MNVMHSRSLPGGFLVSNRISRARSSAGLSLFVEAVDLPAEVLVDLIPLDLHRRRDLAIFLAACLDGNTGDPQLREALQMTQREIFRVNEEFGQAMAWENVEVDGIGIVDKPGGLNNASAYIGLVPAQRIGVVLLANRGEFPHEIVRYRVLPALARL